VADPVAGPLETTGQRLEDAGTPFPESETKSFAVVEAHFGERDVEQQDMARASRRKPDPRSACIFGDSTGDEDVDRILAALRAAPEGMTRHEIRRGLFADHKPATTIASKLALLLRQGLVRSEPVETRGRPAEKWLAVSGPRPGVKSVESRSDLDPFHANYASHALPATSDVPAGVASTHDGPPDRLDPDPAVTPEAAESCPAGPPSERTSRSPAVAGPSVPVEWHGPPLDGHWHTVLARVHIAWRRRWADRAEAYQAAGLPKDLAEYLAYRWIVEEIAAG
jgi:hypothetical protein